MTKPGIKGAVSSGVFYLTLLFSDCWRSLSDCSAGCDLFGGAMYADQEHCRDSRRLRVSETVIGEEATRAITKLQEISKRKACVVRTTAEVQVGTRGVLARGLAGEVLYTSDAGQGGREGGHAARVSSCW